MKHNNTLHAVRYALINELYVRLCCCYVLSGPPTDVGIDFFVQTFGPLDEVAMVSEQAAIYRPSTIQSIIAHSLCMVTSIVIDYSN